MELMDLVQAGNLGLMRAAERYDPSLGYRFSTYAYWWVRQAVTRCAQEQGGLIKLPYSLMRLSLKLTTLEHRAGRRLNIDELSCLTNERPSRVHEARRAGMLRSLVSLDQPMRDVDGGESTLQDMVSGKSGVDYIEDYTWLNGLLCHLSELERLVLRRRHGDGQTVSLQQLGRQLGKSKSQVQTIERRALRRLRVTATQELKHNN
jgi:RNA polymerase sigma factor (sigma-70 family)